MVLFILLPSSKDTFPVAMKTDTRQWQNRGEQKWDEFGWLELPYSSQMPY